MHDTPREAQEIADSGDLAARSRSPGWLLGFAWFLVASTFFLIGVGGHVTSTDSGDAIPTWPLPLVMEMEGGVLFELGHRQVAGFVGIVTGLFWLTVLLLARSGREIPRKVRVLSVIALVLVIFQAALGGGRVLLAEHLGGPESIPVTSIAVFHTLLGQTFLCFTLALVFYLRLDRSPPADLPAAPAGADEFTPLEAIRGLSRSANLALGFVFLQLFLGALLRLVRPGPVPMLVLIHILGAVLAAYGVFEVVFRVLRHPASRATAATPAFLAGGLIVAQLVLGFAAYFAVSALEGGMAEPEITWRTVVPTLHLTVGTLILVTIFWIHLAAKTRLRSLEP